MRKKIIELTWMTGVVFIFLFTLEYIATFGFNKFSFSNAFEILPSIARTIISVFLIYATIIVFKSYRRKSK